VNTFFDKCADALDGNGASQFDKNASIAINGFLNIFGRVRVTGVECDEDECVNENCSLFDLSTTNFLLF